MPERQNNIGSHFILKDWLLLASAAGLVLTSIYRKHLPTYSIQEIQVLFILFILFVVVKGLENSGLILKLSKSIEEGVYIPLKLVSVTFCLSMFVTNDVALVVIVPLTLAINTDHKDVLVILETLAANAGSALTPIGNPQNLFIYWFYDLSPTTFIRSIAPLPLVFLALLVAFSFTIKTGIAQEPSSETIHVQNSAYAYAVLLALVLLTVFRVLPVSVGFLVLVCALLVDRKSLRIDFALLLSFFCFFGLADNMRLLLTSRLEHSRHVFLLSAVSSQIMSNVPATLLFAKFTTQWDSLLWGTNVGGFGSPIGSLANLIAYRIYVTHDSTDKTLSFTTKFLVFGYAAFLIGIGLYLSLRGIP
ncbi:MAG: hypothetical protein GXP31_05715 [Kiritimatiellaeota bacterium]|nr:hypothetical protein [Kiritimatiellota bacterium]